MITINQRQRNYSHNHSVFFYILILIIITATTPLSAQKNIVNSWQKKFTPHVLQKVQSQQSVDVIIRVHSLKSKVVHQKNQPKLLQIPRTVKTLQNNAALSQKNIIKLLKRRGIDYQSFWISNAIAAHLSWQDAVAIASLDEVTQLEPNASSRLSLPKPEKNTGRKATQGLQWHITKVKADQAWNMGYRGQGVVVAGQDTGYQWDHPALKTKYRGWNANSSSVNHNYNWHDAIHTNAISGGVNPCGYNTTVPCDDDDHGTHTMGIIVGDDGNNEQIGIAPDAKWIGCRNMDSGNGRPSTYMECFEWFLAPTDLNNANADANMAPDIINNSWGCPPSEECAYNTLQETIENVRNAGILVVSSAGNAGPGCHTVQDPPPIYASSFSVGATTSTDSIALFSSRGPVSVDGSNRLKPDISAPGYQVYSSIPTDSYTTLNGTSMAAPVIVGAAALVMSASPAFRHNPKQIEALLMYTAEPLTTTQTCGSYSGNSIPNAVFGHGRVDAYAATVEAITYIFFNNFE